MFQSFCLSAESGSSLLSLSSYITFNLLLETYSNNSYLSRLPMTRRSPCVRHGVQRRAADGWDEVSLGVPLSLQMSVFKGHMLLSFNRTW